MRSKCSQSAPKVCSKQSAPKVCTKCVQSNFRFFFSYLSVGGPILVYNIIKSCLLFKASHKVQKREQLEEKFKNRAFKSQLSIPQPEFYSGPESLGYVSQNLYPVVSQNSAVSQNFYPVSYIQNSAVPIYYHPPTQLHN